MSYVQTMDEDTNVGVRVGDAVIRVEFHKGRTRIIVDAPRYVPIKRMTLVETRAEVQRIQDMKAKGA